ncbi:MAG: pentapeptide repeat-containing protein [Acidobacteriota bacterium]|nr:pentapeptide repeat-containing protein [Acidobacteriota bacterium]
MSVIIPPRPRPEPWSVKKQQYRHRFLLPLHRLNWMWEWFAHFLSNWVFLDVLEYLGRFSVLIAVIYYFAEAGDRKKQKHYQAWQVVNTAQGKGGSGGRVDALEELNHDRVPLVGVDVSGAFLQGIRLPHADLLRSNLDSVDARSSVLRSANLTYSNLKASNLRNSDLTNAKLEGANLEDADLAEADLTAADLTGVTLDKADLRNANLHNIKWQKIGGIKLANIRGVKKAPDGFTAWATQHGAVSIESDDEWIALQNKQ